MRGGCPIPPLSHRWLIVFNCTCQFPALCPSCNSTLTAAISRYDNARRPHPAVIDRRPIAIHQRVRIKWRSGCKLYTYNVPKASRGDINEAIRKYNPNKCAYYCKFMLPDRHIRPWLSESHAASPDIRRCTGKLTTQHAHAIYSREKFTVGGPVFPRSLFVLQPSLGASSCEWTKISITDRGGRRFPTFANRQLLCIVLSR